MDPRYPVGQNQVKASLTVEQRNAAITEIAALPGRMRDAIAGLTVERLDTPYRPGGWTIRQVVHHVPDSHMHAFLRFKLALTEDQPLIKPYDEARTAELADYKPSPEGSLALLAALHERWAILLRAMQAEQFARTLRHPERGVLTLDGLLDDYAWHGRHHVAHITSLRERMGWRCL